MDRAEVDTSQMSKTYTETSGYFEESKKYFTTNYTLRHEKERQMEWVKLEVAFLKSYIIAAPLVPLSKVTNTNCVTKKKAVS